MQRFRREKTLQKFVAVHASIHNHFNQERHLNRRKNLNTIAPQPSPSGVNLLSKYETARSSWCTLNLVGQRRYASCIDAMLKFLGH